MTPLTVITVVASLLVVSIFGGVTFVQAAEVNNTALTSGKINDTLKDEEGNPVWLLTGHWKSNLFTDTKFNHTNPGKFSASIKMVMANGSSPHEHKLSHFTLNNMSTEDNSTAYDGSLSVSMKLGPVFGIPVVIRNFQNETISISLESLEGITTDQMNVISHFENKSISGTFTK